MLQIAPAAFYHRGRVLLYIILLLFAGRPCAAPVPYFRRCSLCRTIAGGRQKACFAVFAACPACPAFPAAVMRLPAGFFAAVPACGLPALK